MSTDTPVTRRFNVNIGEGWRTTAVVFHGQSPLALVSLRNEDGEQIRSRFDIGKKIYIDPPFIEEGKIKDRQTAEAKTFKHLVNAQKRALA